MNQHSTKQILEEIKNRGGNLSAVARGLGLNYQALKSRYGDEVKPLKMPSGPEPLNIKTLGKQGMGQYVIAVKLPGHAWPEKYAEAIADARRKFDAGTHEMFQGRHEDGWVVQYLIPYLVPRSRRQFFSTMIVIK